MVSGVGSLMRWPVDLFLFSLDAYSPLLTFSRAYRLPVSQNMPLNYKSNNPSQLGGGCYHRDHRYNRALVFRF
jgi:hypothetical protein